MARAPSPALSETDFDISKSLFAADDVSSASDSEEERAPKRAKAVSQQEQLLAHDSDDSDSAFILSTQVAANRNNVSTDPATKKKTSGAFQTMGLSTFILKAVTRKGFTVPTPIQRKTIPLILDGQDVVGMARTGSGKTAAFVIPMIEKLKQHSAKVGARAIVLSPSRELALQTLRVVKELSKGCDLRTTLLVGGDSLEEQFTSMSSNPDIIIATPGRFEHLKVEMSLSLESVRYVVFDEADRLFEMGFAAQLMEIMHSLPSSRQTLLFSATLPKSLVEFARAGLQDPKLVRLDAESKISPGLESTFFSVKRQEKEGALLHILQDVIHMPTGATSASIPDNPSDTKKRKRSSDKPSGPSAHSTVIFASTKHHVDYLHSLLTALGYATSHVYGSLDQTARKMQVHAFRTGQTNILVVTDVAARGLDIPVLANVINYDFPAQPKIYVHRVGRTARAGKGGWSYSLVTGSDMPYLLDLQLFLSRRLVMGTEAKPSDTIFKDSVVLGALVRDPLERCTEEVAKLLAETSDLALQRDVAGKGEKQYLRTRNAASAESVKRAKQIALSGAERGTNVLFAGEQSQDSEQARLRMLEVVAGFRPVETVFEVGKKRKVKDEMSEVVAKQRVRIERGRVAKEEKAVANGEAEARRNLGMKGGDVRDEEEDGEGEDELVLTMPERGDDDDEGADMSDADEATIELAFTRAVSPSADPNTAALGKKRKHSSAVEGWQDTANFMSYTPVSLDLISDRGYGVHTGGTNASSKHFLTAAADATMDLAADESSAFKEANKAGMRWDKKGKKYVNVKNDVDGSKGTKFIKGESGQKIPASLKSGRFERWRRENRVERMPRVGELEKGPSAGGGGGTAAGTGGSRYGDDDAGGVGGRFKHKQLKAPKEADKYRDDYFARKKKVEAAKEARVGRFAEGKGKSELRDAKGVQGVRAEAEKRREKNARPARDGEGGRVVRGRGGGGRGAGSRGGSSGSRGGSRGGRGGERGGMVRGGGGGGGGGGRGGSGGRGGRGGGGRGRGRGRD